MQVYVGVKKSKKKEVGDILQKMIQAHIQLNYTLRTYVSACWPDHFPEAFCKESTDGTWPCGNSGESDEIDLERQVFPFVDG